MASSPPVFLRNETGAVHRLVAVTFIGVAPADSQWRLPRISEALASIDDVIDTVLKYVAHFLCSGLLDLCRVKATAVDIIERHPFTGWQLFKGV